jgi:hypothetical protein
MAEYFLKASDATHVYRITYTQAGSNFSVDKVHVCGTGGLPNGDVINSIDQEVNPAMVVVDQVLSRVAAGTVADYRTAAKAQIDASW